MHRSTDTHSLARLWFVCVHKFSFIRSFSSLFCIFLSLSRARSLLFCAFVLCVFMRFVHVSHSRRCLCNGTRVTQNHQRALQRCGIQPMWCAADWNHRTRSTSSNSWSLFYRHAGHTSEWFTSAMRYNFRQFQWKAQMLARFYLYFIYTNTYYTHIHIYQRTTKPFQSHLHSILFALIFHFYFVFFHHHKMYEIYVCVCIRSGIRFDSIKMVMHMATTIFININERERSSTTSKLEHGWTRNVLFIYSFAFFYFSLALLIYTIRMCECKCVNVRNSEYIWI